MIQGYRHCEEGGALNFNFSGGLTPWRRFNWSPLQIGWDLSGQGGYHQNESLKIIFKLKGVGEEPVGLHIIFLAMRETSRCILYGH